MYAQIRYKTSIVVMIHKYSCDDFIHVKDLVRQVWALSCKPSRDGAIDLWCQRLCCETRLKFFK